MLKGETMINGKEYIAFLKIGKKENLLKLQNGNLYMKEAKFFRDIEKKYKKSGMGDKYDSCRVQCNAPIWINGIKLPNADFMSITNALDEKTPIFCCMCLKKSDFIYNSQKKLFVLDKNKFDIETLKNDFGDYVLVIPYPECFIERIRLFCQQESIDFRFKEVIYVDYSEQDNNWHKLYENDLSQFFIKDKLFLKQKEFRLLLANVFTDDDKDFYSINIPNGFKDFTKLIPIEDVFTIGYGTKEN